MDDMYDHGNAEYVDPSREFVDAGDGLFVLEYSVVHPDGAIEPQEVEIDLPLNAQVRDLIPKILEDIRTLRDRDGDEWSFSWLHSETYSERVPEWQQLELIWVWKRGNQERVLDEHETLGEQAELDETVKLVLRMENLEAGGPTWR